MQELFYQLLGYLKGIWNKRWSVMFVSWLICFIGWGVIYVLPDQYESKATIYVDTESLLKPLLEGLTVQQNTGQQINLMVKTLLTRPNIEKIIRLSDLDLSINDDNELDALVSDLQEDIQFKKKGRGQRSPNVYDLLYINHNPEVAQIVLQSVITVFIENSIGDTKEDSSAARRFLKSQIKEYEKRLVKSENRLKDFKQKNYGMLPAGGQNYQGNMGDSDMNFVAYAPGKDYYGRLEGAKNSLETAKLELKEAEKRQASRRQELAELTRDIKSSTSFDERIVQMNKNLDDLLLNYTEQHPDVLSMKRLIEGMVKSQEKERQEMAGSGVSNVLKENMLYQELTIAYGEAKADVGSLKVRVKEYEMRYLQLQKMVKTVPEIEAQLSALNRDYDITKKKYEEFLARRESASISESVDQTTESVQFKVLEAPRVENIPVGPKRVLLSSGVLLAGILGGLGFGFMLSQIKPVVASGRQLSELTGLPILGSVSANDSPAQKKRRAALVVTYLSLFIVLLVCYGLLMAWYLFIKMA